MIRQTTNLVMLWCRARRTTILPNHTVINAPMNSCASVCRFVNREALDCSFTALFGPDSDCFIDWYNEDLAITDLSGLCCFNDCLDCLLGLIVRENDFKFYFRKKINSVLTTAVNFCMTLLTTEALDFTHSHPFDSNLRQSLLNVLHLKGFDDRLDFLHNHVSLSHQLRKGKETEIKLVVFLSRFHFSVVQTKLHCVGLKALNMVGQRRNGRVQHRFPIPFSRKTTLYW